MLRRSRWPSTLLGSSVAAALYLALPCPEAEAAKPQRSGGFDEGGYIMGTPGSLVVPITERNFAPLNPSFGWSLGGGYMFARGKLFKATIGGVFEHTVLLFDFWNFNELGAHVLRIMPEARIGLGSNKVWGYGLFGAGATGTLWHWNRDLPYFRGRRGNDAAAGFNGQWGGGVQGIVYKNLFLGGEIDFDMGLYYGGTRYWNTNRNGDFWLMSVAFEFTIGWYF